MRNQINFLTVFCLLQLVCETQRGAVERSNFKPPKIVEAKTYKIPFEETIPPNVVPASGMKKVLAGKPETVDLKSNIFSAKPTRVVLAGPPKLILPKGEVYKLPEIVPPIDSPFIAGAPEIILKDLFIKENNESFELSV